MIRVSTAEIKKVNIPKWTLLYMFFLSFCCHLVVSLTLLRIIRCSDMDIHCQSTYYCHNFILNTSLYKLPLLHREDIKAFLNEIGQQGLRVVSQEFEYLVRIFMVEQLMCQTLGISINRRRMQKRGNSDLLSFENEHQL